MTLRQPLADAVMDAEERALFLNQKPGIALSLQKGLPVQKVLGDLDDFYALLNNHIVRKPKDIRARRKNILLPVGIKLDAPDRRTDLYNVINEYYNSPELVGQSYELYVPLCGETDSHWRVCMITVQAAKISDVVLYDPKATADLSDTPTYQTVKLAAERLCGVGNFTLRQETPGIQKNGHSCFDYCVQKILTDVTTTDPKLQAIVAAGSAETLRDAVVSKIKTPVVDVEKLHSHLLAEKEVQKNFDEEMAKQLDLLFKSNPNNFSDDNKLFDLARSKTCEKLLPIAGFFSNPRKKPEAAALPEAATATSRRGII